MKFAAMSIDFKLLPLKETFKIVSDYGFDGLEIFGSRNHIDYHDWNDELRSIVNEYINEYNLEIPMYTPNAIGLPYNLCSVREQERKDGIEYFKKAIDIAHEISCPRVLVIGDHPGLLVPKREILKNFSSSVRELCKYAEDKTVQITVEPLCPCESPSINTVDDCLNLLDEVNHPNLYIMMDVVPPTYSHEPISKYFEMLGTRLNYIHICNTDGMSDAHYRLDKGILSIKDLVGVIHKYEYNGYITTELYSESPHDPEVLISSTADYLKNICNELNIKSNIGSKTLSSCFH